jgi:hypothetical protein
VQPGRLLLELKRVRRSGLPMTSSETAQHVA